jgi:hypothetical protein
LQKGQRWFGLLLVWWFWYCGFGIVVWVVWVVVVVVVVMVVVMVMAGRLPSGAEHAFR